MFHLKYCYGSCVDVSVVTLVNAAVGEGEEHVFPAVVLVCILLEMLPLLAFPISGLSGTGRQWDFYVGWPLWKRCFNVWLDEGRFPVRMLAVKWRKVKFTNVTDWWRKKKSGLGKKSSTMSTLISKFLQNDIKI